jgi:uncharacterized protein (TIGR00269 family)
MKCKNCRSSAAISTSNGTFCKEHFKKNFERITLWTIKKYGLIRDGETIAIANSGGKDSLSLLYILQKYFKHKNKLVSITIDEGIVGYRDKTIETMKDYCGRWGVDYKIYSYNGFAGATMDTITKIKAGIPCATCGVFRRYLLNFAAFDNKADKIATAHNLDDEAENVMMNLFQNDFDKLIRLGPISGTSSYSGFVPRIKPFMFLSEKETMLFSILNGINAVHTPCPYSGFGFRGTVSKKIKELESEISGSKRRIIDTMMEMKENYVTDGKERNTKKLIACSVCDAPATEEICEACNLKMQINRLKSH